MITGIDETGDFDPNSKLYNYFVGVHIDQNSNKFTIKQSQFNIWESSLPLKYQINGEFKGQNLPDEYLDSFFKDVLNQKPSILYSVVSITPADNSKELLEKHKIYEIEQFEKVIEEAKAAGHKNWSDGYLDILKWYKNRNYQIIIKMKCLNHLLGISLNNVIGWGQLTYALSSMDKGELTNLSNITFKIDKDFVKGENVKILWTEILRQFWQEYSKKEPIPSIEFLFKEEENPLRKLFGREFGVADMTSVFKKNTQFYDSKHNWEIRMADLVGTILHRYQNRGKLKETGELLIQYIGGKKNNYAHLILNDIA